MTFSADIRAFPNKIFHCIYLQLFAGQIAVLHIAPGSDLQDDCAGAKGQVVYVSKAQKFYLFLVFFQISTADV